MIGLMTGGLFAVVFPSGLSVCGMSRFEISQSVVQRFVSGFALFKNSKPALKLFLITLNVGHVPPHVAGQPDTSRHQGRQYAITPTPVHLSINEGGCGFGENVGRTHFK